MNYNKQNTFFNFCHRDLGIEDVQGHLKELYLSGMSSNHIAEHFYKKYGRVISPRGIDHYLKEDDTFKRRTYSEAKKLAMKSGRMIYRKKPEHEKYKAKYVSVGKRIQVLQRDDFRCCLCGNGRHNGYSVEIHHKKPESSELVDLQTLCYQCHRGLHALQREAE